MAKNILVVPDVHGRTFWKKPVSDYAAQADRIVFLGDYLDPYRNEEVDCSSKALYRNLMEIISLKLEYRDKVILLKGNHDQHYSSRRFRSRGAGTRMDHEHWDLYHCLFNDHRHLFQLAHREVVGGTTYVFTHAGLTAYWLNKVNQQLWHLDDCDVSVAQQETIDRINALDDDEQQGQDLLAVVGYNRSMMGERTGSVLWADVNEHSMEHVPAVYGLNQVFQVFGHTRMNGNIMDILAYAHHAMIDSQKCFLISETLPDRITPISENEGDEPI